MRAENHILVVSGLVFEARIATKVKGTKVCCGQAPGIAAMLAAALTPGCCGILSFGVVGGLDPKLRAGSIVIPTDVISQTGRYRADPIWSASLRQLFPDAVSTAIFSGDSVHVDADTKRQTFAASGAVATDTESHVAARLAHAKGLPFAVLRVVADPAHRSLPVSALAGVGADGRTRPSAVLRGLAKRPREVFEVAALAKDAWIARMALAKAQKQLGHGFHAPVFANTRANAAGADLQFNLA